jgi:hypothetical protein
VVTVVATALFMIPIDLVTKLQISNEGKLGIVFGSIVVFIVVVRWFSKPRQHELIAMVAA